MRKAKHVTTAEHTHDNQARRTRLALGTLALGAFVIGTAELVIVGILNLIAKDT